MMVTINAEIAAIMAVLPSAVVGFCFWIIEQKIQKHNAIETADRKKRQQELDDREKLRKEHELMLMRGVSTAVELSEATARAVQKIPDAHCNGEMKKALESAERYRNDRKTFFESQAVDNMYAAS